MRDVIFVIKGKLRKSILTFLRDKPKTGKRLSKELGKHLTSVSRTLLELEKKRYISCINPDDDRHRYYKITNKGESSLNKILELEK
ncbi:helix-turn-helix transcriptional regulator [Candidatus Woesearchaeota archaeon]|nr:helix-turn-helix transcriptional regulator [Candidatus Woesearchaeota archaeon]